MTALILTIIIALLCAAVVGMLVFWHRARKLSNEVLVDELTGLGNRRALDRAMGERHAGSKGSVAVIDCDYFKQINDSYGHAEGDNALIRLAESMAKGAKPFMSVGAIECFRIGGDEFVICGVNIDSAHMEVVIENVRVHLVDSYNEAPSKCGNLTISCGIAEFSDVKGNLPEEVMKIADEALYTSKQGGRGRTTVWAANYEVAGAIPYRDVLRILGETLATAVDAVDGYTHAHSRNVSDLAVYIANEMNLQQSTIDDIALAGLLHDVGKIAIPAEVLKKRERLTADEWEKIKKHCDIGYSILSGIDGAEEIRQMVLYHHERFDGMGYPTGLAGDRIPLGARVITVADAFDAMTADRGYAVGMSTESALEEMAANAGTQFDPQVLKALFRLMLFEAQEEMRRAA